MKLIQNSYQAKKALEINGEPAEQAYPCLYFYEKLKYAVVWIGDNNNYKEISHKKMERKPIERTYILKHNDCFFYNDTYLKVVKKNGEIYLEDIKYLLSYKDALSAASIFAKGFEHFVKLQKAVYSDGAVQPCWYFKNQANFVVRFSAWATCTQGDSKVFKTIMIEEIFKHDTEQLEVFPSIKDGKPCYEVLK